MLRPTIGYDDITKIARDGSPLLMQAVGRIYGFGQGDLAGLRNGLPTWALVLVLGGAGFIAGLRVHKRYGHKLPKLLTG